MLQWRKTNVSSKNPIAAANHLGIPSYTEKDVFNLLAITTPKLRKLLLYINHLCLPNFRGSPGKGLLQDVNSKGVLQLERCWTADPPVRKYPKWLKINTTCRFCDADHCSSQPCPHGGQEKGGAEIPQWIRTGGKGAKTEYASSYLVAQTVKNLPVIRETRVRSLGWEDPLEKEMAAHSSILAWKIPWTEEPGGLQSTGSQRVGHSLATTQHRGSMFYPLGELWRYYHIAILQPKLKVKPLQQLCFFHVLSRKFCRARTYVRFLCINVNVNLQIFLCRNYSHSNLTFLKKK